MLEMKKKIGILLAVLFLLSVTAATVSAAIPPDARISATPISGHAPLLVTFTDKSIEGKALWKWWSFGDGTGLNSMDNTVIHIYWQPGTYTAYLKATNTAGSDKAYVHITVTNFQLPRY